MIEATDVRLRAPEKDPTPSTVHMDGLSFGMRVLSHLAIWGSLIAPAINEAVRGWRALGDNTGIAYWSYQALSAHPRLVGQESSGISVHPAFSLGPLQYWLLAIPVHIDPVQGAL